MSEPKKFKESHDSKDTVETNSTSTKDEESNVDQTNTRREDSCSKETSLSEMSQPSTVRSLIKKEEKFVANEEYVQQIVDMGICRNGAIKALYWTDNQSALAASNWIFDQPDRDLDTPLEDELEMIRAQAAEREREEREEGEMVTQMCGGRSSICHHIHPPKIEHNHNHHHWRHVVHHRLHHHQNKELNGDEIDEDMLDEDEEDEDDDEDEEDEDIDDDDEEDMDFKLVLVVNRGLELKPGSLCQHVAKATVGLFRKINSAPQAVAVGPDELSMWEDLGERIISLCVDSDQHMSDLQLMANNLRLPCHLDTTVREDKLRKTVLALFGEEKEVNKVTGRLKVMEK